MSEVIVLDRLLNDIEPEPLIEAIRYQVTFWGCTVDHWPQPQHPFQYTHVIEIRNERLGMLMGKVVYEITSTQRSYKGRLRVWFSDWENDPDPHTQARARFNDAKPEPRKRQWFTELAYVLIRRFEGTEAAEAWLKQWSAPESKQGAGQAQPTPARNDDGAESDTQAQPPTSATATSEGKPAAQRALHPDKKKRRDEVKEKWLAGITQAEIAETLGIGVKTVQRELNALGLSERRPKSDDQTLTEK